MTTTPVIRRQRTIALLADRRGAGFVQTIILVSALALGSVAAVKGLGGRLGSKLDCTGDAIARLAPGATPCPDRGSTPDESLAAGAVPVAFTTRPPDPQQFTPEDEDEVKALIADALERHDDDIALAFADLRDQRQRPENFFDSNLAIAADYLRARLETQHSGPAVARTEVEAYIALKRTVGVPKEGPGPVSPFSELQARYMRQGVEDEANEMSFGERLFFASPPGVAFGTARAAFGLLRGDT